MKANIKPQWPRLAKWYWEVGNRNDMSLWAMLLQEYGAYPVNPNTGPGTIDVEFPDEKMYTAFVLRWS